MGYLGLPDTAHAGAIILHRDTPPIMVSPRGPQSMLAVVEYGWVLDH